MHLKSCWEPLRAVLTKIVSKLLQKILIQFKNLFLRVFQPKEGCLYSREDKATDLGL